MTMTETLVGEHRVIEQVLNALDRMVQDAAMNQSLDWEDAAAMVDFFRVFADQCHHHKEEDHLFRWLESQGFSRELGPTGVMMEEHECGRRYVAGMAAAVALAATQPTRARQQFIDHAQLYITLLRQHIRKEEHCLFPMAEQIMSEADEDAFEVAFDYLETRQMVAGTHERYVHIADNLAAKYGIPSAAGQLACCGCDH